MQTINKVTVNKAVPGNISRANTLIPHASAGQALLEVLIALAVAMIVLTGLLVASVTSVRNATFSRNTTQANALNRQGLDFIRVYRDTKQTPNLFGIVDGCYHINPARFINGVDAGVTVFEPREQSDVDDSTHPCNPYGASPDSNNTADMIENVYVRRVRFQRNQDCAPLASGGPPPGFTSGKSCMKATVYTYWNDSTGLNKSQASTLFGDWQ